MNRFLYGTLAFLAISATCQAQTFIYQPNILEQYSAPRHVQYYNYGYYNTRTFYYDQQVTVPVRTRVDVHEYRPYHVQYNWTATPPTATTNCPFNCWQPYQYYVPYRY